MDITNFTQIHSSPNVQGLQRSPANQGGVQPTQQPVPIKDSVSFSEEALRLSNTVQTDADSPRIRFDLINRIKAEINAGTYDTPEKMDIALERMASRIF